MALRIQSPANVGWLDDDAAEAASSKVVSLRFGVIGASSLNDTAGIERLYSGLGGLGAAFLHNWLKIAEYLSDSPAAADGTLWASGILTTRSRYSREGFHVPLRHIEGPEVKIGTEYADSALADGILGARLMLPAAMAFSAASPLSSWSAVARGQFLWRLRCTHRTYGPSAAVDNVSRIAYISSLEAAHDFFYYGDRQRHLASPATVPSWRRCTREPTRSTADYSRSQLFYYFWCRETCSFGEPSLCNVPLRNSHRFAEAFGCPPNRSAMNPSEKCAFW
ncbi:uncharacterized protein LOC144180566 [Haemaphysalis longicornis]